MKNYSVNEVKELMRKAFDGCFSDNQAWIDYLQKSAYLYKYSFQDQLIISAMKPYAKAVADMKFWNNDGSTVNPNTNGVPLVENSQGYERIHYVYDITDTNSEHKLWQANEPQELINSLNIHKRIEDEINKLSFANAVIADEVSRSVQMMIYTRLGIDTENINKDFSGILSLYNTSHISPAFRIGKVVNSISSVLLQDIEAEVQSKDRQTVVKPQSKEEKSNIIGNTPYNQIKKKTFRKFENSVAQKIVDEFNKSNIKYSGRINDDGTTTLTFFGSDKEKCLDIIKAFTEPKQNVKNNNSFTPEEIEIARQTNLVDYLRHIGEELRRVGTNEYEMAAHDSMRIEDGNRFYWNSQGFGGNSLDFLMKYYNMPFQEAVGNLLAFNGYNKGQSFTAPTRVESEKPKEPEPVININPLPNELDTKTNRVYAYLTKTRHISGDIVSQLISEGKIAQDVKGNAVFKITDENGNLSGAEITGTLTEKRYKQITERNNNGFFVEPKDKPDGAIFFEAAIDLLSYYDLHRDTDKMLVSMAGLKDSIVMNMIDKYSLNQDECFISSDNDESGKNFADKMQKKYGIKAYRVNDEPIFNNYPNIKDWNDLLTAVRKFDNIIENAKTTDNTVKYQITEDDIAYIIKKGTRVENGKNDIATSYDEINLPMEREQIIRQAYGIGTEPINYEDGSKGYLEYNSNGLIIRKGEYISDNADELYLTWSDVEIRIRELIANDEYLNENQLEVISTEKTFAEQVDDSLNGKIPFYSALKVCDTPDILLQVGCEQLPMLYTQKHLKDAITRKNDTNIHTHGLSVNIIKNLPNLINEPIIMYDSLSRNDSIVTVTNKQDLDNLPIVVTIKPNGRGRYELETVNTNFITSVHGRNNLENQLKIAFENNKLLYISKKSQDLFKRWGLQLPELINNLDFDTIIHQSNNIVNTKTATKNEDLMTERNYVQPVQNQQENPIDQADNIVQNQQNSKYEFLEKLKVGSYIKFDNDIWKIGLIIAGDKNNQNRNVIRIDNIREPDMKLPIFDDWKSVFKGEIDKGNLNYLPIGEMYSENINFYKLGDFFEAFNEDAILISETLNLVLTYKSIDGDNIPMVGIPYHSLENYVTQLTEHNIGVELDTYDNYLKMYQKKKQLIENTRKTAVSLDLPFSEKLSNGFDDNFDPYVYDGSMTPEDFYQMQQMQESNDNIIGRTINLKDSSNTGLSILSKDILNNLPDTRISIKDRNEYGYTSNYLLPITKDWALSHFDNTDFSFFKLYEDNTESLVDDIDDIQNFDGIFGIETVEWQKALNSMIEFEKSFQAEQNKKIVEPLQNLKENELGSVDNNIQIQQITESDGLKFSIGFTESSLLKKFADENPNMSFALANSVIEYLDEKRHTERENEELAKEIGSYDKTHFSVNAIIDGENYNYDGRYDIGDGKGLGGGSIVDYIREYSEYYLAYEDIDEESKKDIENVLNLLVPYLEQNVQLTEKEQEIFNQFKADYPIRNVVQQKTETVNRPLEVGDIVTLEDKPNVQWRVSEINDLQINFENVDDNAMEKSFSHIDFGVGRENLAEKLKYTIIEKEKEISENSAQIEHNLSESNFNTTVSNAFDIVKQKYDFSSEELDILDFVENQMKIENKNFDFKMLRLPPIQQKYGTVSKVNDIFNNNLKDIADTINSHLAEYAKTEHQENSAQVEHNSEVNTVSENNKLHDNLSEREKPKNFHITDSELGVGTPREKFRNNINAIKTLKQIEGENRQATPEEQKILSKYVGWGGLQNAFDSRIDSWSKECNELKSLLTDSEYSAARASVLDAHYTPPVIINSIYTALNNLGFESGKILEPSMGIGNFFGLLPENMQKSKLYGVELDSITGRIAKQLYPAANIQIKGFEKTAFRSNTFDVAVGNVPFGSSYLSDNDFKDKALIHDYFFKKSLDKVRSGGIIAFVTSSGTLDKKGDTVRKYLAERADLLGAVRLPNNAFKNAGTPVVADIIFLQKKDRVTELTEENMPEWMNVSPFGENGTHINNYFKNHPEMVCGELEETTGQHGYIITCKPTDIPLDEQLNNALSNIKGTYEPAIEDIQVENEFNDMPDVNVDNYRNFCYAEIDGQIYFRENEHMIKQFLSEKDTDRLKGLINISNLVQDVLNYQKENYEDALITQKQNKLNAAYDEFTSKYGILSSKTNKSMFRDDDTAALLLALENIDNDGKFISKADIFTKRTIMPYTEVTSVDTASEALAVSISEKAKVDIDYMADLCSKSQDEIISDLEGVIFKNPLTGQYENSDEYLSGNVREKLEIAKQYAENDNTYLSNVSALAEVQPQDLTASEISVQLGSTWIPVKYYEQFMYELLDTPRRCRRERLIVSDNPYASSGYYSNNSIILVSYDEYTSTYGISNKVSYCADTDNIKVNSTYGTNRANAYKIIEDTLNLKPMKIYDYIEDENGKTKPKLNETETLLAQEKQNEIKDKFQEWIFSDKERTAELVELYNRKFNSTRPREYDGSHITFSGINPEITLRKHQKDAIAHTLYGGNTLLAHTMGAGKTFEIVASAMESKRLGLCSKSMIVVPKHIVNQMAKEFLQLYPGANILVPNEKDFSKENREKFCSRIATGNYDAVIISHTQLEKIPLSVERQREFIQNQIKEIVDSLAELRGENGSNGFTVKQMEATKRNLENKLEKLNNSPKRDTTVTFEDLGIDKLYVDEAHIFKNLYFNSKIGRNVSGVNTSSHSQRATDLFMKCQYLDEITGSRGVVFATGTPISNSISELYTMQTYLQHDVLKRRGLNHFDAWASTFAETKLSLELAPEGKGYQMKNRFAKFFNLPELMSIFKEVADIKTSDMLNLPVPKANYHNIATEASEIQQELVNNLSERADNIRARKVDSSVDNMLNVTNDGRKLALDQRLINPDVGDNEQSKANACAENVFDIWKDTADKRSTQMIFCDLSTPHYDGSFNVYDDLKNKLIDKGIPADEIAFVHDCKTDAQKQAMFEKVNNGEIRVLFGSTNKMGTGTNCQKKLIALHHLDCPWRPSDLSQRDGRIIRQGNENETVDIYNYVTKGTFDAYLYQTVENKQKFISQIMTSKSPARVAEDVDETALSFAQIKALCAGDPEIKEKMDLDIEVNRLRTVYASYQENKRNLQEQISKQFPKQITELKAMIKGLQSDIALLNSTKDTDFVMTVNDKVYIDKKEAGAAIIESCKKATKPYELVPVGSYKGFDMYVSLNKVKNSNTVKNTYEISLKKSLRCTAELGADAVGNITRIDNLLNSFEKRLTAATEKLANTKQQLTDAKIAVNEPFNRMDELKTAEKRLAEINKKLSVDLGDKDVNEITNRPFIPNKHAHQQDFSL